MATDPQTQKPTTGSELEEVTLKLPPEMLAFLREEARKRGVSTGDMVRIALGTAKFLTEATGQGAKVQLKGRTQTLNVKV
ncbi:MAG TPA: ribbon-helix-helix domain-containing protein [Croceibacterium sp.]